MSNEAKEVVSCFSNIARYLCPSSCSQSRSVSPLLQMKRILKEAAIPKFEAAKSKEEFMALSQELTREASKRATEAGIMGPEHGYIENAFIERSLEVIYNVHSQVLHKSQRNTLTSNNRESIREKLAFNGRSRPIANKVLLAEAYVDLFVPVEQKSGDDDIGNHCSIKGRKSVSFLSPIQICNPSDRKTGARQFGKEIQAANVPPPRVRRAIEKGEAAFNRKANKTNVLEKTNLALKEELGAVRLELAKTEQELKAAKMAQSSAEETLKVQADVLSQTLHLLGEATAKISMLKTRSRTFNNENVPRW